MYITLASIPKRLTHNASKQSKRRKRMTTLLGRETFSARWVWSVALSVISTPAPTQSLRKAEGSSEKLQHLVKMKDQSIQTLQQDVAVRPPCIINYIHELTHFPTPTLSSSPPHVAELQGGGQEATLHHPDLGEGEGPLWEGCGHCPAELHCADGGGQDQGDATVPAQEEDC